MPRLKGQKRTAADKRADKKRTGRPPVDRERRSYHVLVNITPSERQEWAPQAQAEGLPLSTWIAKPRRDQGKRKSGR